MHYSGAVMRGYDQRSCNLCEIGAHAHFAECGHLCRIGADFVGCLFECFALSPKYHLRKATHGPLATFESTSLTVLRDQSGDLLPGVSADLDEGANHDPLIRPGEGGILESDEGFLYPFITGRRATQH